MGQLSTLALQQRLRFTGCFDLILEGQFLQGDLRREPLDPIILDIMLRGIAADRLHQVVVDPFVVAHALTREPVLDHPDLVDEPHLKASLLRYLSHSGLFQRLTRVWRALWKPPDTV